MCYLVIAVARLVVVSFKVEAELIQKLNQLAMTRKTTRSALLRQAVKEFIEKYERPYEGKLIRIHGEKL